MMLTRRRFLTISAAMAAGPAWATPQRWEGRAFGADVSLTIRGPRDDAMAAIEATRRIIARVEGLFSLYDPASALSELNRVGRLREPDPDFLALMQAADLGYRLTSGLFDPTVQPLWRALADGSDTAAATAAMGWDRVRFDAGAIRLDRGQALTFNGIAQGFATDLVTAQFQRLGLTETLVNIGEYRALGGSWRLAISDPVHGELGTRRITQGAIATSSPAAMSLGAQAHILHPRHRARWSTVSVEADTATLADCLSTALCLAPLDQIAALRAADGIGQITLVDFNGDLTTL